MGASVEWAAVVIVIVGVWDVADNTTAPRKIPGSERSRKRGRA